MPDFVSLVFSNFSSTLQPSIVSALLPNHSLIVLMTISKHSNRSNRNQEDESKRCEAKRVTHVGTMEFLRSILLCHQHFIFIYFSLNS